MNSANGSAVSAGLIIPPNNYDFTELQAREIIKQVKRVVGSQGGQMPVGDVVGVLMMGVLLEKLTALEAKVEALLVARSPVAVPGLMGERV